MKLRDIYSWHGQSASRKLVSYRSATNVILESNFRQLNIIIRGYIGAETQGACVRLES